MRIACVGSRELSAAGTEICVELGKWIVECGHHVYSGNALGADAAFARGGNRVDPWKVHLMLPWHSYNRAQIVDRNQVFTVDKLPMEAQRYYEDLGRQYHPRYSMLSGGAQKLHLRNGMILLPGMMLEKPLSPYKVDLCLAWPKEGPSLGGTGQAIRIAQGESIPYVWLNKLDRKELAQLCDRIAEQRVSL